MHDIQIIIMAGGVGSQQQGVCAKAQASLGLLKPTRKELSGAVNGLLRVHCGSCAKGPPTENHSCWRPVFVINAAVKAATGTAGAYSKSPSQLKRLLRRISGTEAGGFSCIWAKKA